MPSVYDLKPKFQSLLRPLVRALAHRSVTANQITLLAIGISALQGGVLALASTGMYDLAIPLLAMPVVLFIRMALNAIDGMLAKEFNMQTKLGMFLNELGDVFSDIFLYVPLALVWPNHNWWVYGIIILAIIGEMVGVLAMQTCGTRRYDGPFGKSDRAAAFGSLCVLIGLGLHPGLWLDIVLGIMIILSSITIYNRWKRAL